jgi:hypothetical protein
MDAYQLAVSQDIKHPIVDYKWSRIQTSRNKFFRMEIDAIFDWVKSQPLPYIAPVRPDHFDRRVVYQYSCFTLHNRIHQELTDNHCGGLWKLEIPKVAKQNIQNELLLLNVDEFAIYGDLQSLAVRLKAAYKIQA